MWGGGGREGVRERGRGPMGGRLRASLSVSECLVSGVCVRVCCVWGGKDKVVRRYPRESLPYTDPNTVTSFSEWVADISLSLLTTSHEMWNYFKVCKYKDLQTIVIFFHRCQLLLSINQSIKTSLFVFVQNSTSKIASTHKN